MSTLKVTNIQATGETASRQAQGVAAAICGFNQNVNPRFGMNTDETSVQNFNISSYVNDNNGEATVGLTNAMANTSYIPVTGTQATNNTTTIQGSASSTVSALKIESNDADTNTDATVTSFIALFGDLA